MRGIGVAFLAFGCGPVVPVPEDVNATTTTASDETSSGSTTSGDEGTSSAAIEPRDWPANFIADTEAMSVTVPAP